jgi:Mrp family chromosome partitioning ATPase
MAERLRPDWSAPPYGPDEEPIDVPRYLAALRRSLPLIAIVVASMTAIVLALSLALPKTYRAEARIVMDDTGGIFEPADVETVKRRLATVQELLTTRAVLGPAARRLDGESIQTLEDKVESSVDPQANFVDIVARDGDPDGAAAIANAVAQSFLESRRAAERQRLNRARADLRSALERLRGTPGADAEVRGIEERLSELSVSEASAGSELQLAQRAQPPREADSPRPVRNTLFALFASAFLAVLVALGLDQIAPRVSGPRELGRLVGAPVVATVPDRSRTGRRGGDVHRALEAVTLQLPPDCKIVLVADALPGSGGAGVAAALASARAQTGSPTLAVSAELDNPRLHGILGVPGTPGLTDLVGALETEDPSRVQELMSEFVSSVRLDGRATAFDVLPSGRNVRNPLSVLAEPALASLFDELRSSNYGLIVVAGPPLLGTGEGQLLAPLADVLLVVSRVDRTTPAGAVELGDVLRQLHVPLLGVIATGAATATYSPGALARTPEDAELPLRA